MEQGALLQHQLPLHSDYPLSSDHACIDQFPGNAHHTTYANATTVDQLRRDASLSHQAPSPFTFTTTNAAHPARFVPERGVASETTSYQNTNNFTDSSSGSISTSPSSAASSLQYTNYPSNHYTALSTIPGPVQLPQSFIPATYATSRVPPILDGSFQGMLPPLGHSSITGATNAANRESYPGSTPYLARSQLSHSSQVGYQSYPETPGSVLSATAGLSLSPGAVGYGAHMAASSSHGYGSQASECLNFPWPNLEVLLEMTCEGQAVTPEVHAKVEKGFFLSPNDQKWTCYRRNYFSVACNFELHPNINNGRMYLKRNNSTEQIQAMGVRLSSAVDGSGGKNIELVQHTPKRDNGPKTKIDVTKVSPTAPLGRAEHTVSPHGIYQIPVGTFHPTGQVPGPYLPLQTANEGSPPASTQTPQLSTQYPYSSSGSAHLPIPGQVTTHTFERVQFKQATANNGKRRASQQYFHLVVELFADVRKDGSDTPVWVKVAQRVSDKIVVRGRSPSHYQAEGNHGQAGRGGSASGGSSYGTTAAASYGSTNAGGFRSSGGGYGGSGGGSSNGYRTNHYGYNPSPEQPDNHSGSSASSIDDGPMDCNYQMDSVMTVADRMAIHEHDGYQYYTSTIYEGLPQQTLPPLTKTEGAARYSTDPRQYAVKAEYADAVAGAQWQAGGCGRFQGVETSRGYYPKLEGTFQ